jgi:hypothetical protein
MECAVSLRVAVRHGLISINITYRWRREIRGRLAARP